MAETVEAPARSSLYDTDFYEWTQQQARLLRDGRWRELDLDNLVDEVESVGRSSRHEIGSRLAVVLEHLLKWEHQPAKRKYGWRASLREQRAAIELVIGDSPSLQREPARALARAYRLARVRAAADTGLREADFPAECPYTVEQALDWRYLPGPPETDVV